MHADRVHPTFITDQAILRGASLIITMPQLESEDAEMLGIHNIDYYLIREQLLAARPVPEIASDHSNTAYDSRKVTGQLVSISLPLEQTTDPTHDLSYSSQDTSVVNKPSLVSLLGLETHEDCPTVNKQTEQGGSMIEITPEQWEQLVAAWNGIIQTEVWLKEKTSIHSDTALHAVIEEQTTEKIEKVRQEILGL